jgi:hypothetical protein
LLFFTIARIALTCGLHFNEFPYRRWIGGKCAVLSRVIVTAQPAALFQTAKLAQHALSAKFVFAACS